MKCDVGAAVDELQQAASVQSDEFGAHMNEMS